MTTPSFRATALVPLLLAVAYHPAAGQAAPTGDPVPRELVLALIGMPDADIVTGRMPENLPRPLELPAGTRVLGSLVRPEQTTIVAAVPLSPEHAITALRQTLTATGWSTAPAMPGSNRVFVSETMDRWEALCADDVALTISAWRAAAGESYVRIGYSNRRLGHTACDPPLERMMPSDRAPLPTLRAPEGVRSSTGGMSTTDGFMEATTRVETSIPPSELARNYGSQLGTQGWIFQTETATEDVAIQIWQLEEATGRRWHGLLIISAVAGASAREVAFRMKDPSVLR
jgi:hypothetical protein